MRSLALAATLCAGLAAPALAQNRFPTLAVFAGGVERARQSGVIPARQIVDWARRAV